MFNDNFDLIFGLFSVLFICAFVFVIGSMIAEWHKNNKSPRLSVPAAVVGKRRHVSTHSSTDHVEDMMHSSTTYYVTFQVESGDRIEFCVSGSRYGMIAEGDFGRLTFQGSRFLDFERM